MFKVLLEINEEKDQYPSGKMGKNSSQKINAKFSTSHDRNAN